MRIGEVFLDWPQSARLKLLSSNKISKFFILLVLVELFVQIRIVLFIELPFALIDRRVQLMFDLYLSFCALTFR